MQIRSLLVTLACALPLASFIVTGAQAETDDAAAPLQCPPFCPDQGKPHDGSQKRYQDRSHKRYQDRSHDRYDDGKPDFDKERRRAHRIHKRPHSKKHVRLRYYPRYYYDPFYFDRFYYDPFYDDRYYGWADETDYIERLSCKQAIAVLRRQGYRNVKAYDCRGKSYGFYATRNSKKYKIIVRSLDGHITSRKRIA